MTGPQFEPYQTQLGLDDSTIERAYSLHEQLVSGNHTINHENGVRDAAIAYLAARIAGEPRTIGEFAKTGGHIKTDVGSAVIVYRNALDLSIEPASPIDHVSRLCDRTGLAVHEEDVKHILRKAAEQKPLNGSPNIIAAAALYRAAPTETTQRELAQITNSSPVSIRKWIKDLDELLDPVNN